MTIKGFRPESNDFPSKKAENARENLKEAEENFIEARNELEEAMTALKNQISKNPEKSSSHHDEKKTELELKVLHKKKKTNVGKSTEISDLVHDNEFLIDKNTNIKTASLEEWENFKEELRIENKKKRDEI